MSGFEEVINYTSDKLVKTVWYSKRDRDMIVDLYNGECYIFYNVPPEEVENFKRFKPLEEFYNDYIVDDYDSSPY